MTRNDTEAARPTHHGHRTVVTVPDTPVAVVLIAVALAALWLRPTLIGFADPPLVLAVVFGAVLAVGLVVPVPRLKSSPVIASAQSRLVSLSVCAVGLLAVGAAQLLVGHARTVPLAGRYVLLDVVAAVAEEAFFRRLVYGFLRPYGAAIAIVGSTASFALVHLTTYGAWVLPLDLAVGALFAWQREATGRWTVPAITHVVANLLVVW